MDYERTTIPRLACLAADRFGDATAILANGRSYSFTEVERLRRTAARALLALGVRHGDRIAIWAPNIPEWVFAGLGVHSVGAIIVPISTRMKGTEVADILNRSEARILFSIGDFLGEYYPAMLNGHKVGIEHCFVIGTPRNGDRSWDDFLALAGRTPEAEAARRLDAVSPDDLSDMIFTSGTTGFPKGVLTAHGQNLRGVATWVDVVGVGPHDRHLVITPFFHTFGYKYGWVLDLMTGATMLPLSVFTPSAVLRHIVEDKVTLIPGPPTLFEGLLAEDRGGLDLSSLRAAVTGASSIPPILVHRMREELGFSRVHTAYGLTESCGFATITPAAASVEVIANTSGVAIPGTEVRCIGPDGQPVAPNETGEIVIRGYNVMRGYFNDEDATRATIDADGWLHTGDIGSLDEAGNIRILDRLKDMYISGGFNCYPAEIERLMAAHPAIAQIAVVGIPDGRLGEVGCAFVVLRSDASASEADIVAWCRANLANYKVPRRVVLVDALPVNAAGKVQKRTLRGQAVTAD